MLTADEIELLRRAVEIECPMCGAPIGALCVEWRDGSDRIAHMARFEAYADHRHRMSRP